LQGALWELDQDIALLRTDDVKPGGGGVGLCRGADGQGGTSGPDWGAERQPSPGSSWKVEADGLTIAGFKPAGARRAALIAMAFKKPHEVVGNHIAKYQSMRLAKMLMAYDFDRG
jgi:hypothetical protein